MPLMGAMVGTKHYASDTEKGCRELNLRGILFGGGYRQAIADHLED